MEVAWSAVQAATGTEVSFERYFSEIGRAFPEIMDRLGLTAIAAQAEDAFRMESLRNIALATFYDGVADTLARLCDAGFKVGIVTSKDAQRTGAVLASLPVDFITIQTPNGMARAKPAPDHLLLAMVEAHADPAETVYIGDMVSDHEAAERAGIDYFHADWGYGEAPDRCADRVARFVDLRKLIKAKSS